MTTEKLTTHTLLHAHSHTRSESLSIFTHFIYSGLSGQNQAGKLAGKPSKMPNVHGVNSSVNDTLKQRSRYRFLWLNLTTRIKLVRNCI